MAHINTLKKMRNELREEIIPSYYSAKAHLLFLWVFVPLSTIYPLLNIDFSLFGVIVFLITLLLINYYFYLIHRYLLHRNIKGFKWCYKMHMIHHKLYNEDHMEYEELNDIYMLLMPPMITILYYLVMIPLITIIAKILLPQAIVNYAISSSFFFWGLYEFNHYCEHLNNDHKIFKIKFFKFLSNHHKHHHNHKLMNNKNFDIALGINDYLFKTNKSS